MDNYLADETSEGVCIERIRSRSLWPEICSIDQILKYYIAVVKSGVIEYVLKNVHHWSEIGLIGHIDTIQYNNVLLL